jgi:hypothetical protein
MFSGSLPQYPSEYPVSFRGHSPFYRSNIYGQLTRASLSFQPAVYIPPNKTKTATLYAPPSQCCASTSSALFFSSTQSTISLCAQPTCRLSPLPLSLSTIDLITPLRPYRCLIFTRTFVLYCSARSAWSCCWRTRSFSSTRVPIPPIFKSARVELFLALVCYLCC